MKKNDKVVIKSFDNFKIKKLTKLKNKKYVNKYQEFIIEDQDLLKIAYENSLLLEIYTTNYSKYSNDFDSISVVSVTEKIIAKISNYENKNDFIALVKIPEFSKNEIKKFKKIIILDNIQDPGNMGNIIRNSLAFDFEAILLINNCVSPYNDKVIKASKGAILQIPIINEIKLEDVKDFHHYFFLLDENAKPLTSITKTQERYSLIYGNEGSGINPKTLNTLKGTKIYIPIKNIESLNVASASAIGNHYFFSLNFN